MGRLAICAYHLWEYHVGAFHVNDWNQNEAIDKVSFFSSAKDEGYEKIENADLDGDGKITYAEGKYYLRSPYYSVEDKELLTEYSFNNDEKRELHTKWIVKLSKQIDKIKWSFLDKSIENAQNEYFVFIENLVENDFIDTAISGVRIYPKDYQFFLKLSNYLVKSERLKKESKIKILEEIYFVVSFYAKKDKTMLHQYMLKGMRAELDKIRSSK